MKKMQIYTSFTLLRGKINLMANKFHYFWFLEPTGRMPIIIVVKVTTSQCIENYHWLLWSQVPRPYVQEVVQVLRRRAGGSLVDH
jgi:hypothetical protein